LSQGAHTREGTLLPRGSATIDMLNSLFLITTLLALPVNTPWYQYYEQGVRSIERGEAVVAVGQLERALELRSEEGVDVATRSFEYIDYLPHLYLSIAHHMSGDVEEARRQLSLAEISGVAEKSVVGKPLLVGYQILLQGPDVLGRTKPRYAVYVQKPSVLTEEEFQNLKADVLAKCGLYDAKGLESSPWYTYYEIALALERKGDPQRALNFYIEAVERRPDPQRRARMYGMWLIDYFPYYQIAKAHLQLENYECAWDALEISRRLSEIQPSYREYDEFVALRWECERQLRILEGEPVVRSDQ